MLKWVMLGLAVVVALAAWIAIRRAREPKRPETDEDSYMRNIRSTTGDFGSRPPPAGEMDPMKTPIFPPPKPNDE